jgi:hypothetical protein
MTRFHWIICEQSSRWASALRMALAYHPGHLTCSTTLDEVRSLTELTDLVCEHPHSLVLLEVTPKNLEAALSWLTENSSRRHRVATVALLNDCAAATDVLREAGAIDLIHSPRQMTTILALGKRHASQHAVSASHHRHAPESFENWAWSLLPWQDARRPLG